MPVEGKDPSEALGLAEILLTGIQVPSTILFVTDGIDQSHAPAFVSHQEQSSNQVVCLGVNTSKGGPVPNVRGGFQTNRDGQVVFSALDRKELAELADNAGVSVIQLTVDQADVERINRRIEHHLTAVQAEDDEQPWQDAGYYLLFPLVLVLLFWFRRGWVIRWAGIIVLMAILSQPTQVHAADFRFADLWLTPDQQGRYYFDKGKYAEAAERFEDPLWKGIAIASYATKDFDSAILQFSRLNSPEAYFNLGNAYAHKKVYHKAVESYDLALALRPEYPEVAANRDLVKSIMEKIQAPPEIDEPMEPEGYSEEAKEDMDKDLFKEEESEEEGGQLTPEELQDEQLKEAWLRRIDQSPAGFLRAKFYYQSLESDSIRTDQ
jgi:Ca-activated chloride channel family protein